MLFLPWLAWLYFHGFIRLWILNFSSVIFHHFFGIRYRVFDRTSLIGAWLMGATLAWARFRWTSFARASLCLLIWQFGLRLSWDLVDDLCCRYAWGHRSSIFYHLVGPFCGTGTALGCHFLFSRGDFTHKFRVLTISRLIICTWSSWWLASSLRINQHSGWILWRALGQDVWHLCLGDLKAHWICWAFMDRVLSHIFRLLL